MMSYRARVVMDTNILVSAMLSSRSTPGDALRLAAQACTVLASDAMMAEAEEVIQRSKFDALVSPAARAEFLVRYR
jgi:predicted nucleic acid-binding protein